MRPCNPLNIRFVSTSRFAGCLDSSDNFCHFLSVPYCIRAALIILCQYRRRNIKTIEDIISTWAPPSENATGKYVSFVCDKLNVHKGAEISLFHPVLVFRLLAAMCVFESGFTLYSSFFDEGYELFINERPDLFESYISK